MIIYKEKIKVEKMMMIQFKLTMIKIKIKK